MPSPNFEINCHAPACEGQLVPTAEPVAKPDLWIRVHTTGAWWCSDVPPLPPSEQPGAIGYHCSTCCRTFRIVEGPMTH